MSRRFALGAEFEAFIDREVESGRYGNDDEVVREGLRLLAGSPATRTGDAGDLRRLVAEAREDGTLVEATDVFDRLEAKYQRAAGARPA